MNKLVLGVATLALSAGAASAQVVYPGYSYAPMVTAITTTRPMATAVGTGQVGAGVVLSTGAQPSVWAAMVMGSVTAATRPMTIRQAGTNFARA
jgi:hypothetical protein